MSTLSHRNAEMFGFGARSQLSKAHAPGPRTVCKAEVKNSSGGKGASRPRPTPGNDPRFRGQDPQFRPTPGSDPRLRGMEADKDLQVVKLQNADVQGVARVESDDGWESDPSRVNALIAGDAAALLLFAIIGRINHGEILDIETLLTALPFWMGWFAVAPFTGAFGRPAQDGKVPPAAITAATTWAVATPLSLAIRGAIRGYMPPTPFIIVSLVVTGVLLIGWRSALAAVTTPEEELTPLQRFQRRKNKKGNAFEFMQLLTSLTKRW